MRKLILMLILSCWLPALAAVANDSIPAPSDSITDFNWWHLLKKGKLDIQDTRVQYPRFLGFCVKVYNWGDKAFNSYDPEYVLGTGKRWKAFLRNENWGDSYHMNIISPEGKKLDMFMVSEPTVSIGAYLQYMAVSVGYAFDFSNIIGNKPINQKKFEFAFTCARFSAELYYSENTGGTYMRKFGHYNNGHLFKKYFPGLRMSNVGLDAYYFFNNRKYSQGAAYAFAKYQIKSAGSFIAGFSLSDQDISVDFTQLPDNLKPYMVDGAQKGKFHYTNYCLMLGYGYNWVFAKNFLFNISAIPALGAAVSHHDNIEGRITMFSMNGRGKMGVVWNKEDFFCGLALTLNGHLYVSDGYHFFNSLVNGSLSVGVRF